MDGEVSIINFALAQLGEPPIQSMDDGSASAVAAKAVYHAVRRYVLRDFVWNFALRCTKLAELAEKSLDYSHVYAAPFDCLKAIRIRLDGSRRPDDDHPTPAFERQGTKILTDVSGAYLEYVADEDNTAVFDDSFSNAFAYRLAMELAASLTGDEGKRQLCYNLYLSELDNAEVNSAREAAGSHPVENTYLRARR